MRKSENLFPKLLGNYLSAYLPTQRNYSKNTISSYCDSFRLLLQYLQTERGLQANRITFNTLDRSEVISFLQWLESVRGCSQSTINQRLAGIHSFYKYVQGEAPELMHECQKILTIPFRKKSSPLISYLDKEDIELILAQPDITRKKGRRDLTLLSILYDTGGRVQEIADLTIEAVRLQPPAQIALVGKGQKVRTVPLMNSTAKLLSSYMKENHLGDPSTGSYPLFFNQRQEPLTRSGIRYILQKYASLARQKRPSMPTTVSPHIIRHSKAMHLLEAGINIIYIRDILGHVDVSTTEVYAKSNLDMKRRALEKVAIIPDVNTTPFWTDNADLLGWLENYGRSVL